MDITKILFVLLTLFHNVISRYMKQESNDLSLERSFCADGILKCKNPNHYCDAETHRCTPKNTSRFKKSLKGLNEGCARYADCADTLVCDNLTHKCVEATNTDQIAKKQKCSHVFKRRCKVNSDCPCNEAKMVCEDNECVTAKKRKLPIFPKISSPIGGACRKMDDCQTGLCDNGKCINPKSIPALIALLASKGIVFQKCQVKSDCPPNKECRNFVCARPLRKFGREISKRKGCHGNNCSQRYLS